MSGDDRESPTPEELTDTLPMAETLKLAEAPKVSEAPKAAVEPFKRKKRAQRLRESVVREHESVPPARFMPKAKPPQAALTLRQVTRICFVVAFVGYLLLMYLRMQTVAEVNRAVKRSVVKTTNTL